MQSMLLLLLILIFSYTGTFTTWETFNALSLGSQWSEAPSIGLSPDSGSLPIIKIAARSSLAFLSPVHRYDRRPSSSSRRYSELLATGLVGEPTEEEWRRKDLSACILEADPECLPKRGKVLGQIVCLYFFPAKGWGSTCCLPVWAGEVLQGGWEQRGAGESQDQC